MSTPPDFSRRIPQLDGLRGVAIAMVVAFHYAGFASLVGVPNWVNVLLAPTSFGWCGVDLFFVLSGFLIGGILLDARGSSNYFGAFYYRRVCRIFPVYFAFLVAVLLIEHYGRQALWASPWWTCVSFSQNVWMAIHNDVGSLGTNITWSLAIEEQFYLLLPAVIYFVKPSRLPWVLGAGIVSAPLIRLGLFLANPKFATAMYVLLPCRMDTLLLGVAAACLLRQPGAWEFVRARRRHVWTAIEILTAGCALFLFCPFPMYAPMMLVGYDCLALLFSCVLVASLVDERLTRILQAKWLMSLGGIAYGVYLIHVLVFNRVFVLTKSHNPLIVEILSLVLTILIAKISWKWFEKPFVRLGHRVSYSGKREAPLLVGVQPWTQFQGEAIKATPGNE